MGEKAKESKRSRIGYGSSYRKGAGGDLESKQEIGSVLRGQVWMVKPDREAKTANPCLWMQTGAVKFKNCNNFLDCTTCRYDSEMLKRVEAGKEVCWQEIMRKKEGLGRICRHSLTNRVGTRICAYDYECSKCDFDQFVEDVLTLKSESRPRETQKIKGFAVPTDCYFHDGHTWARIESGGYLRVGMDDFALKLLGTPDRFNLPLMGKELHEGRACWGFRRGDRAADVLSPVGGVIMEVNSTVRENTEVAGREPYEGGWLFMVRTRDIKGAVNKLKVDRSAMQWMNGEVTTLENLIEEVAGPVAADGGYLAGDIYGNLPQLGWTTLTRTFLRT